MANVTAINSAEITRRRVSLEASLGEALGRGVPREELEIEQLADPVDQVKSNTDREIVVQRLDDQARRVREVRSALERIEDGTYGVCEWCEEPIGKRRLDAIPWARLCVECQSRQESEDRLPSTSFDRAA
jgi:DnaK suppressor protein